MIGKTPGHHRIVEKLGAGGMGEVYLGFDQHLQRQVAIKVLSGAHSTLSTVRFPEAILDINQ